MDLHEQQKRSLEIFLTSHSYSFFIKKENGVDKIAGVNDCNNYFPSKAHLTLIRDWINELLKMKDLEIKIKETNDHTDKLEGRSVHDYKNNRKGK